MKALALAFLVACGPATLPLREVVWNPAASPVGNVSALSEDKDTVLVLSDTGATIFVAGLAVAQDTSVTAWRQAAVIPAADGNERWLVSLDATGALRRVRNKIDFEPIGDRYGLMRDDVQSVAAVGTIGAAFALQGTVVIANGETVTRYDTPQCTRFDADAISGGLSGAFCLGKGGVYVLATNNASLREFPIGGVSAVASDGMLHGLAISGRDLWRQDTSGAFVGVYTDSQTLRSPVGAGDRVWAIAGSELVMVDQQNHATRSKGAALAADTRLVGSPSGDVWTISGGVLKRWIFDDAKLQAERDWETNIQPIYVRTCSQCHAPGGSAGVDLSAYQTWVAKKATILDRVVVKANMPPAGTTLSGGDKDTIRQFCVAP